MNKKTENSRKLFQEGVQLFKAGKYKDAITSWEQVLQYFPNHTQTQQWIERARNEIARQISIQELLQRGKNYFNNMELERAIEEWQKILDIEPDHLEADNLIQEARARLELAREKTPPTVQAPVQNLSVEQIEAAEENLLKEGLAFMYTRDYYLALKKFHAVLKKHPNQSEAVLYVDTLKGTVIAEGIFDEWLNDCEELIRMQDFSEANEKLEILALCDEHNQRVQRLKNSVLLREKTEKSTDPNLKIKELMTRSLQLYETGNGEAAIELWEQILTMDPENLQAKKYIETARTDQLRKNTDEHVTNLFKQAIKFHQEGETKKALDKIDAALKLNPTHPGALKMQREILSTLKRKDVAITETFTTIPVDSQFHKSRLKKNAITIASLLILLIIPVLGYLGYQSMQSKKSQDKLAEGLKLLKSGNEKDGVNIIRQAYLMDENNYEAHRVLGDYYFEKKDFAKAVEQFDELKRSGAAQKSDLLKLYQGLFQTRNYIPAIRGFKQLLQENPDNLEAYKGLGAINMEIKTFDEAIQYFRKALSLNPNDKETILMLGDAYRDNGEIAEAMQTYQTGIDKNKHYTNFYLHLGELYYAENKLDQAIETLTAPLLWATNSPELRFSLGNIYQNEQNFPLAIENYTKALDALPTNYSGELKSRILFQKSITNLKMATSGKYPREENRKFLLQAKTDLTKARDLTPADFRFREDYAPYYYYMGEIYWNLMQYEEATLEEAKTEYKLAIQQKENYAEPYAALGKLHYKVTEKQQAVKYLKKSLEINPQQPDVRKLLAALGY